MPPNTYGAIAQLGERLNGIQEVVGSIPISSTRIHPWILLGFSSKARSQSRIAGFFLCPAFLLLLRVFYFVLSPLLCGSCPDCRLVFPPHADEPYSDWHRPSAIQNPAHRSVFRKASPTRHCRANGQKSMGVAPSAEVGRQVPPGCAHSHSPEYCIDKTPIVLGDAAPASFASGQKGFRFFPDGIRNVVPSMGSLRQVFLACG